MMRLGNQIELLNTNLAQVRVRPRHVLFDFDGTVSLVREGWQTVMIPMMLEVLQECPGCENRTDLEMTVNEFVTRLTGKQTIYQMIELAAHVSHRGGTARSPLDYKHDYLERLEVRIRGRIDGLAAGSIDPDRLLLPGARALLEDLRRRGCRLYLASGTDEPLVIREATLLRVNDYFDGGIYGAQDDYRRFSKQMVIDRIIGANRLRGPELLGIGDGYVEIENTKSAGGIAVGVASLEADPGPFDPWKKARLTEAGADVLIPDFREHRQLTEFLFGMAEHRSGEPGN